MVEISKCKEPCFAEMIGGCKILTTPCKRPCVFYKPKSCEDWVRIEKGEQAYIMPPEEYAEMRDLRRRKARR